MNDFYYNEFIYETPAADKSCGLKTAECGLPTAN